MVAILPGLLGVLRAKPYDRAALDLMEAIASMSAFFIIFSGFLFFSDLLTPGDSRIVLWSTVILIILAHFTIAMFVIYDLFPYGMKAIGKMKLKMSCLSLLREQTVESGTTACEKDLIAQQQTLKMRSLLMRRIGGNARQVFRKDVALNFVKSVRDVQPNLPIEGSSSQHLQQHVSLRGVVEDLEVLGSNIQTVEADGGDEVNTVVDVWKEQRSRTSRALRTRFTRGPSIDRSGMRDDNHRGKLSGTFISELRLVARSYRARANRFVRKLCHRESPVDAKIAIEELKRDIDERIRSGVLKPPALGEGIFRDDTIVSIAEFLAFTCNRALFLKVLMLLEYLRLKEAWLSLVDVHTHHKQIY